MSVREKLSLPESHDFFVWQIDDTLTLHHGEMMLNKYLIVPSCSFQHTLKAARSVRFLRPPQQLTSNQHRSDLLWIGMLRAIICMLRSTCPAGVHARYYWTAPQTETLRRDGHQLPAKKEGEPSVPKSSLVSPSMLIWMQVPRWYVLEWSQQVQWPPVFLMNL